MTGTQAERVLADPEPRPRTSWATRPRGREPRMRGLLPPPPAWAPARPLPTSLAHTVTSLVTVSAGLRGRQREYSVGFGRTRGIGAWTSHTGHSRAQDTLLGTCLFQEGQHPGADGAFSPSPRCYRAENGFRCGRRDSRNPAGEELKTRSPGVGREAKGPEARTSKRSKQRRGHGTSKLTDRKQWFKAKVSE